LESRFCDVIATERTGSWQGDEYFIVKQATDDWADDYRYGFSSASYGSCSGCDALQAAGSNGEALNDLADQTYRGIRWFDTVEELIEFLRTADPANNWYANEDEWPALVAKFVAKLEALDGEKP
jgi:hypothetical protein